MARYKFLIRKSRLVLWWKNSSPRKIFVWLRDAKNLIRIVRRSGLKRSLWCLSYIEGTLGGHKSYKSKQPVDRHNCPWPWYTYPAIEYLYQFDFSNCDVFEFGSGNSSKFWSIHAKTVTSVEIDPFWYEHGIQDLSYNQKLLLKVNIEEYVNAIHLDDGLYDVIVIDGEYRYNCIFEACKRLKNGGFIILDNTDWFPNSAKLLREQGFTQVDFIGAGPVNSYAWCTSFFFMDQIGVSRISTNQEVKVINGLVQVAEHDRFIGENVI